MIVVIKYFFCYSALIMHIVNEVDSEDREVEREVERGSVCSL